MRFRAAKAFVVLIALGGIATAVFWRESLRARASVGQPAPEFTLPDLAGRPVRLSDFRGKSVFINFWTTWCLACREEVRALKAFHERYGDRIQLLKINLREPLDSIREYMAEMELGPDTLILRDLDARVSERYRLRAVPESWFIDAAGMARVYWIGAMRFEDMQAAYERATGRPIDGDGVGPVPRGGHLHDLAVDPRDARRVYAATHDGLFISEDGGRTWAVDAARALAGREVLCIATDPMTGNLYAAGPAGLQRSSDGGRTWTGAGVFGGRAVSDVAVDPSRSGTLFAWAPGAGLQASGDGV